MQRRTQIYTANIGSVGAIGVWTLSGVGIPANSHILSVSAAYITAGALGTYGPKVSVGISDGGAPIYLASYLPGSILTAAGAIVSDWTGTWPDRNLRTPADGGGVIVPAAGYVIALRNDNAAAVAAALTVSIDLAVWPI